MSSAACSKIIAQRLSQQGVTPTNSRPSTPTHLLRYPSTNNGYAPNAPSYPPNTPMTPQITPAINVSSPSHFSNASVKVNMKCFMCQTIYCCWK